MRTDRDILDSYGVVKITHLNHTSVTLGKACVKLERGDGMAIYGACCELRAEMADSIDRIDGGKLYDWACDYDVWAEWGRC